MKKASSSHSAFFNARIFAAFTLCSVAALLFTFSFRSSAQGPTIGPAPASGTLRSTNIGSANALNYADSVGTASNFTFFAGNGTCQAPGTCSTFTLTIDPSVGTASPGYDPANYTIFIELVWPHPEEDYDTWVCSGAGNCVQGNVVGSNASTADPETISLPTNIPPGQYTINAVMTTGGFEPYTATVYLQPKFGPQGNCAAPADCTPPRYINYPAGPGQADGAGEPSLGVDWNPNVASLKDTTSPDFTTGVKRLNTGGVAFMAMNGGPGGGGSTQNGPLGEANWRVNFDDCPSPAVNKWEDVSAIFAQSTAFIDPIGFTDHYTTAALGLAYPEPHTNGRVFQTQLIGLQGNSEGAYSDDDGNSYLPGGNGGPGSGPDHETLGGGPYNASATPPPPPHPTYTNAIYYCSQNTVVEAQCSRSDDGGATFGPGIPIYNPTVCAGGIHGHVKVARDGTVYVPNSSCGTSNLGLNGAAVSTDNGLTWTENNVANSTGSQDPSIGIGQNDVGRPAGKPSNTIYLGWISSDGHPHIADSHDRGLTWEHETDVGIPFRTEFAVFPVVVAGDDNRAAFGFLGTGPAITAPASSGQTFSPCNPYLGVTTDNNGNTVFNCQNVWHLYISSTYDGGADWITIDATPNDPVQVGGVCLGGLTCSSPPRNLLDFNDFGIDAEGRGLLGYADGCVNCNNGQKSQSGDAHGTVARQSGGRRLFSHFDPSEPMAPASPQLVSATSQAGGTLVSWLEPDNGGSPITGYKVYRSGTSGAETFLANVSGETNTKYLDTAPLSGGNFYYVQAINAINEGFHCGELTTVTGGTKCSAPYITEGGAGTFMPPFSNTGDPSMGQLTIQSIAMGEPFFSCSDQSITFVMKVANLNPMPAVNELWHIFFTVNDTTGTSRKVFVDMETTQVPPTPFFNYGYDVNGSDTTQCSPLGGPLGIPCPVSGTFAADGTITIKLDVSQPLTFFSSTNTTTTPDFVVNIPVGTTGTAISGNTVLLIGGGGAGNLRVVQTDGGTGTYTTVGNLSCHTLPPIAMLTGTPVSGSPPLTVNFSGSGSHPQPGACGTINSYTLDFGDGSTLVTQSSPTFSHTYNASGEYTAKLTVKDTLNLTSTNPAQVGITVTGGIPPLNGVVSRKTHGALTPPPTGPGDLVLNPGTPVTIEPRAGGGTSGNQTLVFSFQNTLNAVTSVTATANGTAIPAANITKTLSGNLCQVDLTGVANPSHLSVTLHGVTDSQLNSGDITQNMDVLYGDVNQSGNVDAADVGQVQRQNNHAVTGGPSGNFLKDINISGNIDAADVGQVQRQNSKHLP